MLTLHESSERLSSQKEKLNKIKRERNRDRLRE